MLNKNTAAVEFKKLSPGFYWLELKEPNLRLIAGVPPDAVKILSKNKLIQVYNLNGFQTEFGPNSILLNEDLFVNGILANQSEFPILQMFYNQGMGLTFHPNYGKERPLIIGKKEHVESQLNYINYGNNGLNFEEMMISDPKLKELYYQWYYMKARFAGEVDMLRLIDSIEVKESAEVEIKPGVNLKRLEKNVYLITHKGVKYEIDLNLAEKEKFKTTYTLDKVKLPKSKFAVINTGSGDGWNYEKPCFGSMLCVNKQYYLVDCEGNVLDALHSADLTLSDIKGIFCTHAHDDHMSGLTAIYFAKKKITLFATNLVYHSLMRKVMAVLRISEKNFRAIFSHSALSYETWNKVGDLEVQPLHSAHPVETSIFYFRMKDGSEYKTYAHLGDIASIAVIKKMREGAITTKERDFYNDMIKNYLEPFDLKKIDIGGGMIHGLVDDFAADHSKKVVLGHYHRDLTEKETKVGVQQDFGDFDILIE